MHGRIKKDKISNRTANSEGGMICNALNRDVDWEYIQYNRVHGFKKLPEDPKRDVHISIEDIEKLLDELDEQWFKATLS